MSYLDAIQLPSFVGQFPTIAGTTNATSGTNSATSSPTSNTSGATATGNGANSTLSSNQLNQLSNPQLFLQLLVAELQNQDPTNPMNPATILSQTANLSQMEAVNSMTTAIAAEQHATQTSEAAGLIGQTVTASVNKIPLTGKVTQIRLNSNGTPTLLINGTPVPLSAITAIGTAPTSGSTTTAPTATASGGTSTTASGTGA